MPGPNATVRCQTHESHADCGPHMGWSVGGLYDLIDVDGSYGANFLGLVGINVQNRGRNSTSHGWTGAYMTVWNCIAPTFRVRNPPTARNWLIGSIGFIDDSQWWLPPVGDDPEGTYELSGPYYPLPELGQETIGRKVNPFSLYFAQLQQRMRWPESEFREYWIGDIDNAGESDTPEDGAPLDSAWESDVRAHAGNLPVSRLLDFGTHPQQLAFTFTVPLTNAERVVAASLTMSMRAIAQQGEPNDVLYLDRADVGDNIQGRGYEWVLRRDRVTVETIEIDPALLNDGRLNVSLKSNIILDWAVLHAQVTPLAVDTQVVVATADTYVRGGSHKEESFGLETQMWVKNEDDGDNSRRAYLIWNLQSVTRPVVGATVRLFCNASAQEGNVYYAAVAAAR